MSNIYNHLSYRSALKERAIALKKEQQGQTLQRVSERAQIQAPYLTNVLKERAHLNSDQFYSLAQVLGWHEDEMEYGFLLLEWERSARPKRREELKKKIDEIRKNKMQSKSNLKKDVIDATVEENTRYFLNPFYAILNSFLGVPKFSKNPKRIASCLGVDTKQVQTWLKDLVNLKFIAASDKGYVKLKKNFHLPKESPLCEPHALLLQQVSSRHLHTLPQEEKFNFGVNFSADPATKEKIHRAFLQFLKAIEPLVKDAAPEEVYGMRFDLFRWSHEKSE